MADGKHFESQPWQPFSVEGRDYLVKSSFSEEECCYEVSVFDKNDVWCEKINGDAFAARVKELNPNLEAKATYLLKHLQNHTEKQNKGASYNFIKDDFIDTDKMMLNIKTKLQAGVPFAWEFHCTKAKQEFVSSHLIVPLLGMVAEFGRRQKELQNLLKKKDAELKDFKESGYKLSRRNLETSAFEEESFTNRMKLTSGFAESVGHCLRHSFSDDSQELYRQVTLKRTWLQNQDMDTPDPLEEGMSTPERGLSPRKTPMSSPAKSPRTQQSATELSPSKEMELQRREELQRKLADEAERKKRKKKKIKL